MICDMETRFVCGFAPHEAYVSDKIVVRCGVCKGYFMMKNRVAMRNPSVHTCKACHRRLRYH